MVIDFQLGFLPFPDAPRPIVFVDSCGEIIMNLPILQLNLETGKGVTAVYDEDGALELDHERENLRRVDIEFEPPLCLYDADGNLLAGERIIPNGLEDFFPQVYDEQIVMYPVLAVEGANYGHEGCKVIDLEPAPSWTDTPIVIE